jgi:hypothetical protein
MTSVQRQYRITSQHQFKLTFENYLLRNMNNRAYITCTFFCKKKEMFTDEFL